MSLVKKAKTHLAENNMSYAGHFKFAARHGLSCIRAGLYLLIHAILPCFYQRAGSNLVMKLNKHFTDWRKLSESSKDE